MKRQVGYMFWDGVRFVCDDGAISEPRNIRRAPCSAQDVEGKAAREVGMVMREKLIEAMAKAMAEDSGLPWQAWVGQATAALDAALAVLEEPDDEQLDAMAFADDEQPHYRDSYRNGLRAMVATLKAPPNGAPHAYNAELR